ncbi:MAG: HPr kinase/phosphorylase [Novosphingobium sp.]
MSSKLHQATCVAIKGRGLLIEGQPGSGKSSLALSLIDRGGTLVGDDGVSLEVRSGRLFASPAPNISGLLEVRGLGLIPFPVLADVPVALVLRLDPKADRFIEQAARINLLGVEVPLVSLWPNSPALAIKAEIALRTYGKD